MVSPPLPSDVRGGRLLVGSVLVVVLTAAALWATSRELPMVWDEGNAILRAEAIPWQWHYTTTSEGHPAFYGIVIAAGQRLSAGWLPPLDAARFGPMMLFALAAGAMFYRMGRDYSAVAAIAAVGALLLMPRLFAHAHFASIDGPLVSCWILAWAGFPAAGRETGPSVRWRNIILWGVLLGFALASKATGWIAPIPLIVWTAAYRDRAAAKTLVFGIPVALLTFFVLNPPLWQDPLHGWVEFFSLNLYRPERSGLNIPVLFLGEVHHFGNPLPWYNTLLWTAVTVPVGILFLAVVGLMCVVRWCRIDRAGMLLAAHWAVLLIVRALPTPPPHDGVRLFLPSFAFLAALAGIGAARIVAQGGRLCHEKPGTEDASTNGARHLAIRWQRQSQGDEPRGGLVILKPGLGRLLMLVALALAYVGGASSLYWYSPQWLSYYNVLIGGLPGATAAGMEPTYYWDGLDRSMLDWLDTHTGPDENVRFGATSAENLALLRRWGMFRPGTQFEPNAGVTRWYVLQRRPGLWPSEPIDPWLIEHCRPVHRKVIGRPELRAALNEKDFVVPWPWQLDDPSAEIYDYREYLRAALMRRGRDVPRPWRLDVPLVEVYAYRDYLRAEKAIAARDSRAKKSP